MRKLCKEFEDKFDREFKFVIDFVKDNKDVFMGIRNNSINLYANGGSFFKITKNASQYIASINIGDDDQKKGYYQKIPQDIRDILSQINNQELTKDKIERWKKILINVKDAVKSYMLKHDVGQGQGSSKEKILQQNLALSFNNQDVLYYNYDIEYNIEGLNDYYYFKDGTKDINRDPHTLGRMDNMVISINKNKVKVYLFELKEGMKAIEGTNYNSESLNKKYDSFGNGIIGHINLYMTIINYIKQNKLYISEYCKDYNKENQKDLKPISFDIRNILLEEIKYIMTFYKRYGLINNPHFINIDYDKLVFDDVELVFYLGDYNKKSKKLEYHLGILGNNNDSVLKLVNANPMNYRYINSNELYNFKVYKDEKSYNEPKTLSDLDVNNYDEILVLKNDGKVSFDKVII